MGPVRRLDGLRIFERDYLHHKHELKIVSMRYTARHGSLKEKLAPHESALLVGWYGSHRHVVTVARDAKSWVLYDVCDRKQGVVLGDDVSEESEWGKLADVVDAIWYVA